MDERAIAGLIEEVFAPCPRTSPEPYGVDLDVPGISRPIWNTLGKRRKRGPNNKGRGTMHGYAHFYPLDIGIRCHYCLHALATGRDHVISQSIGGGSAPHNVVPCCEPCNQAKADTYPVCVCLFCERARLIYKGRL